MRTLVGTCMCPLSRPQSPVIEPDIHQGVAVVVFCRQDWRFEVSETVLDNPGGVIY